MTRFRPSWNAWLLLALTVLAAGLRLYKLDEAVLSRDEGSGWRVSRYEPVELIRHCAANVHAPLSFFLLKWWIGVFGDSIYAMRSLSVVYGVLCVPMMYWTVLEAGNLRWPGNAVVAISAPALQWGALFAAALVTLHPLQLDASRTARMYSLGALLTLVSAWLLLRALQAAQRKWPVWIAYSLAGAALAYTHTYGLLVLAAHLAFAFAYVLIGRRRKGVSPISSPHSQDACTAGVSHLCLSAGLILVLYSPWLPVLRAQTAEVGQGYWIRKPTFRGTVDDLGEWIIGERFALPQWFYIACVLVLVAGTLIAITSPTFQKVGPGRAERQEHKAPSTGSAIALFILIAMLPWHAVFVFYVLTGQAVLQLRYLTMAQSALFAICGLFFGRTAPRPPTARTVSVPRFVVEPFAETGSETRRGPSRIIAIAIGCSYGVQVLISCVGFLGPPPSNQLRFREMAFWLATQYHPGDVILVEHFRELTRTEYYLSHAGINQLRLHAESFSASLGHMPHRGSLRYGDILPPNGLRGLGPHRLWHISHMGKPLASRAGCKLAESRVYGMLAVSCFEQIRLCLANCPACVNRRETHHWSPPSS